MKQILEERPRAGQDRGRPLPAVKGEEEILVTIAQLDEKINNIYRDIEQAVELTIKLRAQSPAQKMHAVQLWEKFLGQFFSYLRRRSRESQDNLLAGISWTRLNLF